MARLRTRAGRRSACERHRIRRDRRAMAGGLTADVADARLETLLPRAAARKGPRAAPVRHRPLAPSPLNSLKLPMVFHPSHQMFAGPQRRPDAEGLAHRATLPETGGVRTVSRSRERHAPLDGRGAKDGMIQGSGGASRWGFYSAARAALIAVFAVGSARADAGVEAGTRDAAVSCDTSASCGPPAPYCHPGVARLRRMRKPIATARRRSSATARQDNAASVRTDGELLVRPPLLRRARGRLRRMLHRRNCGMPGLLCHSGTCGSCGDGICSRHERIDSPQLGFGPVDPTLVSCSERTARPLARRTISGARSGRTSSSAASSTNMHCSRQLRRRRTGSHLHLDPAARGHVRLRLRGLHVTPCHPVDGDCDASQLGNCLFPVGRAPRPGFRSPDADLKKKMTFTLRPSDGNARRQPTRSASSIRKRRRGRTVLSGRRHGKPGDAGVSSAAQALCLDNARMRGDDTCSGTTCACSHCPQSYDDCGRHPRLRERLRVHGRARAASARIAIYSGACRSVIDNVRQSLRAGVPRRLGARFVLAVPRLPSAVASAAMRAMRARPRTAARRTPERAGRANPHHRGVPLRRRHGRHESVRPRRQRLRRVLCGEPPLTARRLRQLHLSHRRFRAGGRNCGHRRGPRARIRGAKAFTPPSKRSSDMTKLTSDSFSPCSPPARRSVAAAPPATSAPSSRIMPGLCTAESLCTQCASCFDSCLCGGATATRCTQSCGTDAPHPRPTAALPPRRPPTRPRPDRIFRPPSWPIPSTSPRAARPSAARISRNPYAPRRRDPLERSLHDRRLAPHVPLHRAGQRRARSSSAAACPSAPIFTSRNNPNRSSRIRPASAASSPAPTAFRSWFTI